VKSLRPAVDYYAALRPAADDAHPLDRMLDASREVRQSRRRVKQIESGLLETNVRVREYADAWLELASTRENLAFNLGIEIGAAAGRAEALRGRRAIGAGGLMTAVRRLMREREVSGKRALPALLEMAWALARDPIAPGAVAAIARARVARGRSAGRG
jgi:urease accessory protein UreF